MCADFDIVFYFFCCSFVKVNFDTTKKYGHVFVVFILFDIMTCTVLVYVFIICTFCPSWNTIYVYLLSSTCIKCYYTNNISTKIETRDYISAPLS